MIPLDPRLRNRVDTSYEQCAAVAFGYRKKTPGQHESPKKPVGMRASSRVYFHKELIIIIKLNGRQNVVLKDSHGNNCFCQGKNMMKNFFEKSDERYAESKDEGVHTNLVCDSKDQRPIGRWGRMHGNFLKAMHPELYEHLILNGSLHRHLADANERAESMLERLIDQMKQQEGITERLKAEQPMAWVGRMNSIRSRAEEIVQNEVIHNL